MIIVVLYVSSLGMVLIIAKEQVVEVYRKTVKPVKEGINNAVMAGVTIERIEIGFLRDMTEMINSTSTGRKKMGGKMQRKKDRHNCAILLRCFQFKFCRAYQLYPICHFLQRLI